MPHDFRFVHCADVHLDTPYRSRSESLRRQLREAGRHAFERVADLCLEKEAHALLIAGDFFDNDRLSLATEGFIVDQVQRLTDAGVWVFLATGNHDPGANNRAHRIAWPAERFHLFRSHSPESVLVTSPRGEALATVIGAGHQSAGDTLNLAASYPEATGSLPCVAILHTQVENTLREENHKRYAPCTREELAQQDYAYWALGHVHKRQRVTDLPPAWYPGNLQGRHHGEQGAKGALFVSVNEGHQAKVEFHPLAGVRWETLEMHAIDGLRNLNEIAAAVRTRFDDIRSREDVLPNQQWMLRVCLRGPCPLAIELREAEALEELGLQLQSHLDVLDVEVRDEGITSPVDIEEHRDQPHLLGSVLNVLRDAQTDDELLRKICPSTLAGFTGDDEEEKLRYLRALLEGTESDAAEQLLREQSS